ncbi:MAG: glycosyl hydrolase [Saprospiraceae bacterium]
MKNRQLLIHCLYGSLLCFAFLACDNKPTVAPSWPDSTYVNKPWTRWWWQGSNVTKEGITAELEALQQANFGGVEITPIYGVIGEEDAFIDYLSPEWVALLEYTLQEAARLGLGVDMATGTGWPFGGPWVGEAEACKYVVHKTYHLTTGQQLGEPIQFVQEPFVRAVSNQVLQLYRINQEKKEPLAEAWRDPSLLGDKMGLAIQDLVEPVSANKDLQALALDQVRFEKKLPLQTLMAYAATGEAMDLTDKVAADGRLDWTAPTGDWTLYALFQGWHGKMVERAAPGGEGNVIDHFSTAAIKQYLTRFDQALEGKDMSRLRAFFNDSYEVDDARGVADWTPRLLEAFQQKRGYDLRQHLPALFEESDMEQHKRVLSDYRETISDLILETFTKTWGEWARTKGAIVRNQAHGSPANILDLYAACEIPETEGTEIIRAKFASSAAHVAGRALASAEAATWLDEHFTANLSTIKENVDRYLIAGVNHIFYHGTCYSPPAEPWPGRLFYAAIHANSRNTLWPAFPTLNQYIERTQSFLQAGKPDNDILLYFPMYDRFATPGRELIEHFDGWGPNLEGTAVKANADFLQEKGYAFDFISDRQIQQLQIKAGRLETGGTTYQTIVVPETTYIPLETMQKLVELTKAGATVIFHRSVPKGVPGWHNLDAKESEFETLLADAGLLKAAPLVGLGEGRFLVGNELDQLLLQANIARATFVDQGLSYTRRKYEDGQYYFLTNWSDKTVDDWITLPATTAESLIIFDPMTGQSGSAQTRKTSDGKWQVYLQLVKGQSMILQTASQGKSSKIWPYWQPESSSVKLDKNWSIEFIAGGPVLAPKQALEDLGSWTDLKLTEAGSFSGTGRYSITFSKPEATGVAWLLDLGEVHETALVRLNGQELGTLIGPVYQMRIDQSLIQETNVLEVEVSNLMANRIADMDQKDVFWKKFYNVNFPPRLSENRGKNGLFDATNWAPRPSGLLGPVSLTIMAKKVF